MAGCYKKGREKSYKYLKLKHVKLWLSIHGRYVRSSNDSSVKGISWVAHDLANLRPDSWDAQPPFYVCFPHFFTHTYEIVRRVSEKKI